MRVVVLVKEVPDTFGPRRLDVSTGLTDRAASDALMDEIDERALELGLSFADEHPGTEVVALSMGPTSAEPTVRKALAMGADRAVLVADESLAGADIVTTAEVLAKALQRLQFDVVIAGDRSTDGSGGVLPAAVAEFLRVPHATSLSSVTLTPTAVHGTRVSRTAKLEVSTNLPAVISVTEAMPDARFSSLKSTIAARRKPVETWTMAGVGVIPDGSRAHSKVIGASEQPRRSAGTKITDEGDAAERLVDFLAAANLL